MTAAPDLLQGLSPDETARVSSLGTVRVLAPGEVLFGLGASAEHLFVVQRGRLALSLPMRIGDRDEDVFMEERVPGQALGWSALVPPHRFTLTATAAVETEVLCLARTALDAYFTDHGDVGYVVTRNLAAVIGHRLQVLQAMWLREMQRLVSQRAATAAPGR
jgi:CRP-like cAMP-binding protein